MQEYTKDYYSILGVSQNSASQQIKSAYYKLAKKYHPDNGGDETKMKEINEAYEILGNIDKKAEYDIWYLQYYKTQYAEQNVKSDISTNQHAEQNAKSYENDYYDFKPHKLTDEEMEALFKMTQKKRDKKYNITKAIFIILKLTAYVVISILLNKKFNSNEYFLVVALIYSFITYLGMFTSAYINGNYNFGEESNPIMATLKMYIGVSVLIFIFHLLTKLIDNPTTKIILNKILLALLFVFLALLCFIIDIVKLILLLIDILTL